MDKIFLTFQIEKSTERETLAQEMETTTQP